MKTNMRLLLLLWAAISTREVLAQRIIPDVTNVEYANVNGISLKLDIYLPKNVTKPYPVIVWIHGGGWISGSKEHARGYFKLLAAQGYNVVFLPDECHVTNIYVPPTQSHWRPPVLLKILSTS